MPLDPNIILQAQAPKFDNPIDIAAKAMTLKQLAQQGQIQGQQIADNNAMREAFKNNVVTNPDGTSSVNQKGLLSDLYKSSPMQAMNAQKSFAEMGREEQKALREKAINDIDLTSRAMGAVKDPNSYASGVNFLKSIGVDTKNFPEQYDPNFIKTSLAKALTYKEQLEQAHKERSLDIKEKSVDALRGTKENEKDQKDALALNKHLETGWATRGAQAGRVQGKINDAEASEALIQQGRNQPGGLDSRQIEELAQSTARLLGGGTTASARVEALVPHTFFGRSQSLKEWLSNKPQGAEMQAFVDRMAETVSREKALAMKQIKQFQIEGLPVYDRLKKKNPELYNSILSAKGIASDMIDEKGRYKEPRETTSFDHLSDEDLFKAYSAAGGK